MTPSKSIPSAVAAPAEPLFDATVLGAMFGNEPALIASVLQTFVAGTQANLAGLDHALAGQDLSAIAALAHKIAGASRMSGALAMGGCAHRVEQFAKQGDGAALAQELAKLVHLWTQTLTAMAAPTAAP